MIREFTDNYTRVRIAGLSDEEIWDSLKPLTRLVIELGKLIEINTLKDDIPFPGVGTREYYLQRLFYWLVFNKFYREYYNVDEVIYVNFAWYRLTNSYRQTEQDVCQWCVNNQLDIQVENVQ